jgi:putative ABC transport system permease protein
MRGELGFATKMPPVHCRRCASRSGCRSASGGVTAIQDTGLLSSVAGYKSPYIPQIETNALSVETASLNLPAAAGSSIAQGATASEPVAELAAAAAQLLGIDRIIPGLRIWVGGQWFYVTGILSRDTYAPSSTLRF